MCLFFTEDIDAVTKTWICNTNADNKENWVSGDYMKNCTGFHFPVRFGEICVMSLRKLTTSAIYLPEQGDVVLRDNTDITLSEDNDECVMVRDDLKLKNYYDPECWMNENEAVPDLERSPCSGDLVVFPPDATYAAVLNEYVEFDSATYMIRNQRVSEAYWTHLFWSSSYCSEFVFLNDYHTTTYYDELHHGVCRGIDLYDYVCNSRKNWRQVSCSKPVYAKGHCTLFCGSVFLVEADTAFDIAKFVHTLANEGDQIDVYYSVMNVEPKTYQITMTDKGEFKGDSILPAQKFYAEVKTDLKSWGIINMKADFSGFPINTGKNFKHAMGIMLGTFSFAILVFALLYMFYIGPLEKYNFTQRIPAIRITRPKRKTTRLKPFNFAKFENKDDGVTSIYGSVVSLEKAFDNPMYGYPVPSTSSGPATEPIEKAEEIEEADNTIVSGSEFSNPLYKEDKTVEQVTED
ncbi:Amnionless [Popillia japonica]|uniref:Protein amnionless n=1 Tax=Popillia japonica TaxID=7064 RepID=A0AAW1KHE2_POPJA